MADIRLLVNSSSGLLFAREVYGGTGAGRSHPALLSAPAIG
jgi:hypothetical protein